MQQFRQKSSKQILILLVISSLRMSTQTFISYECTQMKQKYKLLKQKRIFLFNTLLDFKDF